MRRRHPDFGNGCYVDSTPLPNEAKDNPFNALCSHGVGHVAVQTRLVLVLDESTGLPVWYKLIPGNVLDVNTIRQMGEDLEDSLGIKTAKEYVNLLPLCKWNATTISGKILLDVIDLIIYLQLREKLSGENGAVTEMFGNAQSLMCHCDANGTVKIETPNKKVKEFAKALGTNIPAFIRIPDLKKMATGKM